MSDSNILALDGNAMEVADLPPFNADDTTAASPPPDSPIAAAPTMQAPSARQIHPFLFTGNASEYFRIWIVNIALSIATLGIYSAWAKVRKLRYFYGNTTLDGAAFEYTADPIKILKGRIIAVVALAAVSASKTVYLPLYFGLALLIFIALPWLVIKSRSFNLRNTLHRNVRFDFKASYGEAAKVFIAGPLLTALSLGLAYPWYAAMKSKFIVDKSSYGTAPMKLTAGPGQFFPIFVKLVLLMMGIGFAAMIVMGIVMAAMGALIGLTGISPERHAKALVMLTFVGVAVFYLLTIVGSRTYLQAATGNLIWNNASMGEHRFQSTLKFSTLLWLGLTNAFAIIFSVGLLIPWATIRSMRYRLHNTSLVAHGDLDSIAAGQQQQTGAIGEEISNFFDLDMGL